jgi:16S rRNA (uracil1498-N3)-methyltransferase
MQLFYNPDINISDKEIIFDRDESKHIAKVLRKKEADVLNVTNGKGNLFTAEITRIGSNECAARILEVETEKPKNYRLHMAVAPTKMNDRYEWFLEKATEIGVDEITPIICEHSERKKIKPERYERILQSAMKQSLRFTLPKLNPATSFLDFVEKHENDQLFIAHCEENQEKKQLKQLLEPGKDLTILIGPEGDFSKKEIELALEKGYLPASLGESRLRTETAGIVACNTVAFVNDK